MQFVRDASGLLLAVFQAALAAVSGVFLFSNSSGATSDRVQPDISKPSPLSSPPRRRHSLKNLKNQTFQSSTLSKATQCLKNHLK